MNWQATQALVGAVLLALGWALDGSLHGSLFSFDPGAFLAVVGWALLADYALEMVLAYWRKTPV